MRSARTIFIFILILCLGHSEAKKIKTSLKVGKETKKVADKQKDRGLEVVLSDSLTDFSNQLKGISFSGYEKEYNSGKESFLIVNPTLYPVLGYKVKVDYLDMQDRMLHSRIIEEDCFVPSGETRKHDINSWDKQHTYYYYLGNEPKRIATPYKVAFTPISFHIDTISR